MGVLDGHFAGDLAAADEADKGLVHGLADEGGTGGDGVCDLRGVARTDQVADGVGDDHELNSQSTAAALLGDELLGQDSLKAHGELQADLSLHLCREDLDNTVD